MKQHPVHSSWKKLPQVRRNRQRFAPMTCEKCKRPFVPESASQATCKRVKCVGKEAVA